MSGSGRRKGKVVVGGGWWWWGVLTASVRSLVKNSSLLLPSYSAFKAALTFASEESHTCDAGIPLLYFYYRFTMCLSRINSVFFPHNCFQSLFLLIITCVSTQAKRINPWQFDNKRMNLEKQTGKQSCFKGRASFVSVFMFYFIMFYLSLSNHFVGIGNAYKSYCGGD